MQDISDNTTSPDAVMPNEQCLLRVQGAWWVRRGCVAAASNGFQNEQPRPQRSWRERLFRPMAMQRWLFTLRKGEALLAANGMRLIEFTISPSAGLAVQLDRVIAFEEGVDLQTRYIRRVPLSGAGARHAALLSGSGRAIVAATGCTQELEVGESPEADVPDFDPAAVVAWSTDLKLRFTLHRLTWSTLLSPRGYRETRLTFSGAGTIWLDAGCGPSPVPGPLAPPKGRPVF